MKRVLNFLLFCLPFSVLAGTPVSFTGMITADTTLDVPTDFADINEALDYLGNKTFDKGVTITIQVADGVYNNHDQIDFDHPQGKQVKILGNTTNKEFYQILCCSLNRKI